MTSHQVDMDTEFGFAAAVRRATTAGFYDATVLDKGWPTGSKLADRLGVLACRGVQRRALRVTYSSARRTAETIQEEGSQ